MKRKLIAGLMIAILATFLLGCDSEEVDKTPPVISDITVSVTENSATISWITDEPARGNVVWWIYPGTLGLRVRDTEESTSHSMSLAGLEPGRIYHFRVVSKDASGNIATSEERSFTTAIEGDS